LERLPKAVYLTAAVPETPWPTTAAPARRARCAPGAALAAAAAAAAAAMCGRTRCTLSPARVAAASGIPQDQLEAGRWVRRERFMPSYNVQPGSATPVVRMGEDGRPLVETLT
jgi:hypothetical protein